MPYGTSGAVAWRRGWDGWRGVMSGGRATRLVRASRADIAWVVFVGLNLAAMQLVPVWQTVAFLCLLGGRPPTGRGFGVWGGGGGGGATGGLTGCPVLRGEQDGDYLAEVPLLAMMFVVMVWHSRRRVTAMEEMRRVSEHNLVLLDQQRQFLQDASHELGTPIAIALGHAELIERAATDHGIAADARVAVQELLRMRRLTSRLLLLAATDGPDFVRLAPVDVADLVAETLRRWGQTPRRWSVGALGGPEVLGDWDRLTLALDALIENAVDHTDAGGGIELSARREGGSVVLTVADSGPGIPAAEVSRIFSRFSRIDAGRNRATGGFGLGLAIVKAIAEAHHGSVQVRSTVGQGSAFELHLPAHTPDATPVAVGGPGQPLDHQAIPR